MRGIGIAIALAAALSVSPADAGGPLFEVGVLECRGSTGDALVGAQSDMTCVFRRPNGMAEPYGATMNRSWFDFGRTYDLVAAWVVLAPVPKFAVGDLAGTYGAGGFGSGRVLVGGPGNIVSLRPLSPQGEFGANIDSGVARIELRAGR